MMRDLREVVGLDPSLAADARGPDRIVLPTGRSAKTEQGQVLPGLRLAGQLAVEFGCPLIVVCSDAALPAEVHGAILECHPDAAAVLEVLALADVPEGDLYRGVTLETQRHPLTRLHRHTDVGIKRNYGLLRALGEGSRFVLFLDDDVAPYPGGQHDGSPTGDTLNRAGLQRARAALERDEDLYAVAWTLEDFDDNSVYGHARRAVGQEQRIFASGGALLVRVDDKVPFFPETYNEDWLFVIALAAASGAPRRAIGWAGRVHQQRYHPFEAERARREEAGELLGEGLLNLLEDHGVAFVWKATGRAFWRQALLARTRDVAETRFELRQGLAGGRLEPAVVVKIRTALNAADQVRAQITPDALSSYVTSWLRDLAAWRGIVAERLQLAERRDVSGANLPRAVEQIHLPNHRGLLADLSEQRLSGTDPFDAVLVPTVRGPLHLLTAAAVARRSARRLVLLCSGRSEVRPALRHVAAFAPDLDVVGVDCQGYRLPWAFGSDPIAAQMELRRGFRDTATKRNLGLLLAWLNGWGHVLFLDDDVREVRTKQLRRARAALDRPGIEAAGWAFDSFPDHSVVCHAYRTLPDRPFGRQIPFLGGGGMAVRVTGRTPFFPNVYNEDWFFMAALLAATGSDAPPSVGLLGELQQVPYDPFHDPYEAVVQEFGDVLGESLFRLLPGHLRLAGQEEFWVTQLELRRQLIAEVRAEVSRPGSTWHPKAQLSLAQAELARRRLRPEHLARWCRQWLDDQDDWRDVLRALPRAGFPSGVAVSAKSSERLGLQDRVARLVDGRIQRV